MDGEDRRHWRALLGYVSAQLRSRYAALEAAIATRDPQLITRAALSYQRYARIMQQLQDLLIDMQDAQSMQSHGLLRISSWIIERPKTVVDRKLRLPRVVGDELRQLELLQAIMASLDPDTLLKVSYRQRQGELIMKLESSGWAGQLWFASRYNRLTAVIRRVSEEALLGFVLGEQLERAQMKLRSKSGSYYVHFRLGRQLHLPFGAT